MKNFTLQEAFSLIYGAHTLVERVLAVAKVEAAAVKTEHQKAILEDLIATLQKGEYFITSITFVCN